MTRKPVVRACAEFAGHSQGEEEMSTNWHPMFGYSDEGQDLTSSFCYESALRPFGKATLLPPVAFRSKKFADLEDEQVWTRAWVGVGYQDQIQKSGDLLPFTIGNHGIHIQRQPDQRLVGRFNFAQHGGCRFIPQQCQTGKKTKCSYTACGYSRDRDVILAGEDGRETGEMGQYLGSDPTRLTGIMVDTWGPFIFANLDLDVGGLQQQLGDLHLKTSQYFQNSITHIARHRIEVSCNWKVAGKVFLSGYHLFPAAKRIAIDHVDAFKHSNSANGRCYWSFTIGDPFDKNARARQSQDSFNTSFAGNEHAMFCWVYPNLLLCFFKDHLVSTVLQPTSMATCMQYTDVFAVSGQGTEGECPAALREQLSGFWADARREEAKLAESMHNALAGFQASSAPTKVEGMKEAGPIETNALAYGFQSHFLKQLLTSHTYYVNKPLYSTPGRALNAGR